MRSLNNFSMEEKMDRPFPQSRKRLCFLVGIFLLLGAWGGCVTVPIKDPTKASLYIVKEEFMAVREYAVRQYIAKSLSEDQWQEYKKLDDKFFKTYSTALYLRKIGTDNGAIGSNMNQLRDILLDARQKFYP